MKGLDKNIALDFALAGRLEHGVVNPGGEASLPTHTASSSSTEKVSTLEMHPSTV